MRMIPTQEAKERQLSGWDSYKPIHFAYLNDVNRDHFAVTLNLEAYKVFNLSVTLRHFRELKAEADQVKQQIGNGTFNFFTDQISALRARQHEFMNLEFFYIAAGFEMAFKSLLMQSNFIVNEIDNGQFRDLQARQKARPIHKDEFFELSKSHYDLEKQQNFFPGLTTKSLSFRTICTKPAYIQVLHISNDLAGVVDDYRNLRNEIHLPGGTVTAPNLDRLGDRAIELLIEFINQRIVLNTNQLIQRHDFRYFDPLKEF